MSPHDKWSPFDPKWYQAAFDHYVSTAEELFNVDLIKQQGYHVPDADGSRSSIFRNSAVTNNSFNEQKLRETLEDIYWNNTNQLKANSHANVHTYQWHGHMSDMKIQLNTGVCTFVIPTETFIRQEDRDIFKLSQFYRKWISVQDLLNSNQVFHWHCLLFINRRVYSEYELRIDDHETTIRFNYLPMWLKNDVSVDIYRFDTNAQCRVKITRELCANQWKWKMPVSYLNHPQLASQDHIVVAFNRISDPNLREHQSSSVEVLGDNLEFLKIEDGYIDLSGISEFNRLYIKSELTEWLWMSIFVPKFMHEYPIMLPTDVIYRPYNPDYRKVSVAEGDFLQHVKADDDGHKQVYVDMNGGTDGSDRWAQMIRPIVLQDAYEGEFEDPYINFLDELGNLRRLTVQGADIIEEFHFALLSGMSDSEYNDQLDRILDIMKKIHDVHNGFLDKLLIEYDQSYEAIYQKFLEIMDIVRQDGQGSYRFTVDSKSDINFWNDVSPLIHIPRALVDKYNIIEVINAVRHNQTVWEAPDEFKGKNRFQRPIDPSDFWMFEYDIDNHVWRPAVLEVEHHYPDVYTFKDPTESTPSLNRVFKAFFFYSDNINPRNMVSDIKHATPSWDEDITQYHINQMGSYHDIFMEKFYWMGIRAIYEDILLTKSRWELLEYVIDNEAYARFNDLFMKSSDPFFTMSLSSYLSSENFAFPFDENVSKMNEALAKTILDHHTLTNFEIYLEKTWVPSYFDTVLKIDDIDQSYQSRLIRRPNSTFDFDRVIPIFTGIQTDVYDVIRYVCAELAWILEKLSQESYDLKVDNFTGMNDRIVSLINQIETVLKQTTDLDPEIYSVDDINKIISGIKEYLQGIDGLRNITSDAYEDTEAKKIYETKQGYVDHAREVAYGLTPYIDRVLEIISNFDMDLFMRASNDLRTYFDYRKENPSDNSLLGWINRFNDPWSTEVKTVRDQVFQCTAILYGSFDPHKSYLPDEIQHFIVLTDECINGVNRLTTTIREFYRVKQLDVDQIIIDRLDYTDENLQKLKRELQRYMTAREALQKQLDIILDDTSELNSIATSDTEREYTEACDTAADHLMAALSYIAGEGDRNTAYEEYNKIVDTLNQWNEFVLTETEVFNRITNLVQPPVTFIDTLDQKRDILMAIMEYMQSVNLEVVPDTNKPNYNEVYSIDEIGIVSSGFNHSVGNTAYFPDLGTYRITTVEGTVNRAAELSPVPYRTTTFRNPMWQANPYDSITDGGGLGLMVEPTQVMTTPIVNDGLTNNMIKRVTNIIALTRPYIDTPNPYANASLSSNIERVKQWQDGWSTFYQTFQTNISMPMRGKMIRISDLLDDVEHHISIFTEFRGNVDVGVLLVEVERIITESKIEDTDCLTTYRQLLNYYGTGGSWDSMDEMGALITECFAAFRSYAGTHAGMEISVFHEMMDRVLTIFDELPARIDEINSVLDELEQTVQNPINEVVDKWYRLDNILVAKGGVGYRVGDIVKVVPAEQTDSTGEPIDDDWDVIQNDVILLQVIGVSSGMVTTLAPFLDYAIPYQLQGIRETEPLVGNGFGLTVDFYCHQITESDNTLLTGENGKPDMAYNENDLVAFQFPNIHDLPITYEIFVGGNQVTDFIQRHEINGTIDHPGAVDTIYLRASYLNSIRNMSVHIAEEDYIMYRVSDVNIIDPGAGYYVGQEVVVDTGMLPLRLKVAELVFGPMKGVAEFTIAGGNMSKDENPEATGCSIVEDDMNNIDDEYHTGAYDRLTKDGIVKPATKSYPVEEYPFHEIRHDELEDGDRHRVFMYPDVEPPEGGTSGDPDYGWYAGSRIDNSQHPMVDERVWNGIQQVIPTLDPMIPDVRRIPPEVPAKGEYQGIVDCKLHSFLQNMAVSDLYVKDVTELPRRPEEWPGGKVGATVEVYRDETQNGHNTIYRVRTFGALGTFVYELIGYADPSWRSIRVDWMNCDWHPDIPSQKAIYPTAPYDTAESYRDITWEIWNRKHEAVNAPSRVNMTTYVKDLTIDDLSLFNWSTKEWEDLHDSDKWELQTDEDGFILTCIQEESFSYDVTLFLNKTGDLLRRCVPLRRNAVVDIRATIAYEVHEAAKNISVNVGNTVRIRKLFPYEQKETYSIGTGVNGADLGNEMVFRLAKYMHYRNEIHLEDIVLYNQTTGQFEDVMNNRLFEICLMDPKARSKGTETQSRVDSVIIKDAGIGFTSGEVWAYNAEHEIHLFGRVNAAFPGDGHIIGFQPLYVHNMPSESMDLVMIVRQGDSKAVGKLVVRFVTETVQVDGDGYIHDVRNPFAPIKYGFKVIVKYPLNEQVDYTVIINKNPGIWQYSSEENEMSPTIQINDTPVPEDRLYLVNNSGRLPLVNPSTNERTMRVTSTEDGMTIQLNQMYRRYDRLEVHSVPYSMRSVYVQRHIPVSGYIDLGGKINKPLNKKYFEFWVNGKLLYDEVTIISPTKIFLHGLTSLKNLEIIEINRDPNEFFSDLFLGVRKDHAGNLYPKWDYTTYLDAALEGTLDDSYTETEQEYLLTPVWKQVPETHPEYKNFPPNVDSDDDILLGIKKGEGIGAIKNPPFQSFILDPPTIEGISISGQNLQFGDFGFTPITDEELIAIMNEEWAEEIKNDPYFPTHTVMSDDVWYGIVTRLYDEYGARVHSLSDAAYVVADQNQLFIDHTNGIAKVVKNEKEYDFS